MHCVLTNIKFDSRKLKLHTYWPQMWPNSWVPAHFAAEEKQCAYFVRKVFAAWSESNRIIIESLQFFYLAGCRWGEFEWFGSVVSGNWRWPLFLTTHDARNSLNSWYFNHECIIQCDLSSMLATTVFCFDYRLSHLNVEFALPNRWM